MCYTSTHRLNTRSPHPLLLLFSFTHPPTTEIYTLSLHDALPISLRHAEIGDVVGAAIGQRLAEDGQAAIGLAVDRKSTRLNSSHVRISYAVFCLKKKNKIYYDKCVLLFH